MSFRKKPIVKIAFGVALLLLLAAALESLWNPIPAAPGSYPVGAILSPASDPLLRRACFDCHSDETRWPWYARLPVVSTLIRNSVRHGREEVNFSRWNAASPAQRRKAAAESLEEMDEGEMPPLLYRMLHPGARLNSAEMNTLAEALASSGGLGRFGSDGWKGYARDSSRKDHDDD